MRNVFFLFGLMLMLIFSGCAKSEKVAQDRPYTLEIPAGFPIPAIPEDNQLTENRVELGKLLFFDPLLSRDSSISCGSCHQPEKAFADVLELSKGVEGRTGMRNTPSLLNIAYHTSFNRDGGVSTLEKQVLVPIEDHQEMDLKMFDAVERVIKNDQYLQLSKIAYDREPDVFVITRALAAFQRTLYSGNSPYDKSNLNEEQERGKMIFFGKADCGSCHSGVLFTDQSFRNNGLKLDYSADQGRMRLTRLPEDEGKFKVPSLRNVSVTAPYMHDGSVSTLDDVIDHYISGGKNHPNKDEKIQPLNLTDQEKYELKSFLESLTDYQFSHLAD